MFYMEVPREGRIYVFASGKAYAEFQQGTIPSTGITRSAYGPKRETVVFENEEAIGLYNFKHDLPGESFAAKEGEKPKPTYPAGKISGLMFGDYYVYDEWHAQVSPADTTRIVEDEAGFWFRRIYFTYDLAYSEKLSMRFRLEANSNGRFAGGNLEPYVKDASLRWNYRGKQDVMLGIQPTLTFDWWESFWGLRHIEKTPVDLYRIDSSRDFGVTLAGPLPVDGLRYGAQYGNESGNGSDTDGRGILRLVGRYDRNPGIGLEAFYSLSPRANDQERWTAQGVAGYRNDTFRAGAQFVHQQREAAPASPRQKIDIWSGFAVYDFLPKKADLFARYDRVQGDRGGVETGLPGGEGVDYLLLSSDAPFSTWIAGGEWYLAPSVRVGPNVEYVKYDDDPDPLNFPGQDETLIYRFTFFWTF